MRYLLIFAGACGYREIKQRIRAVVNIVFIASGLFIKQFYLYAKVTTRRNGHVLTFHNRQGHRQFTGFQQVTRNTVIGMPLEVIIFSFKIQGILIFLHMDGIQIVVDIKFRPPEHFLSPFFKRSRHFYSADNTKESTYRIGFLFKRNCFGNTASGS